MIWRQKIRQSIICSQCFPKNTSSNQKDNDMPCKNITDKERRLAELLSEMFKDSLRSGDKDMMVRIADAIIILFGPIVGNPKN